MQWKPPPAESGRYIHNHTNFFRQENRGPRMEDFVNMSKNNQSGRLTDQHVLSKGVSGIFGELAKKHDGNVLKMSQILMGVLAQEFQTLQFRHRTTITKAEINRSLKRIDSRLGQTLFVPNASIRPDGGVVEVRDDRNEWRVVLITEAKHQGKDVENIQRGKMVGTNNDQDLMAAGNAIERSHKNISEIANLMLAESHFPYLLFLQGSNFLTQTITVQRPDGREVVLEYNSGMLNRLDRLTAANFGLPINTNLCENRFVKAGDKTIMLQAASIFTQGDGGEWKGSEMLDVMFEVSKTSLRMLASDLFQQMTRNGS